MKKFHAGKALILFIVILELSTLFFAVDARGGKRSSVACRGSDKGCRKNCNTENGALGSCAANTEGAGPEPFKCEKYGDPCDDSLQCVDECKADQ